MKFDFNLTHLRYFYDSVKLGAVGKAAKSNFVSHSAISQGIKKLEGDLGVNLVTHKKREFKPTEAGKKLAHECDQIFVSLKNFEHQVQFSKENPTGDLNFASSHSVISAFLLQPLAKIRNEFPLVQPQFLLGKTEYIKKWVLEGTVDLGITIDDDELTGLQKIKIKSGKFVLLKKRGQKDLPNRFLITKKRPETRAFEEFYLKRFRETPKIHMTVDSWELITKMVEHGLGCGLVPDFQFDKRRNLGLEICNLGMNINWDLVAISRKGVGISRNSRLLLDQLK